LPTLRHASRFVLFSRYLVVVSASACLSTVAHTFPSKPIKLVVPYPAGGFPALGELTIPSFHFAPGTRMMAPSSAAKELGTAPDDEDERFSIFMKSINIQPE
jgi:hypothetical protein